MKQDLYSHGEFKLFNPNGETFGNKIIGSETTGIMAISEGKYTASHVSDLYDVMSLNIWNPKRTDLTNDIKTVNELTSYEFDAYIDELGFLTYLDSIQTTFPAQLMRHVTAPEFRLLLSFQPLQEGIHCLIDGTEVLTDKGFISFSELTYEHKVAVYNENNSISFEIPQEIICSDYKGDVHEFKGQRFHQVVTPNHRMPFYNYNTKKIEVTTADKFNQFKNSNRCVISGEKVDGQIDFTPTDRLYVAYQADGIMSNPQFQDGRVNQHMYKFAFKKQRKIDRLIKIAEDGNFRYTKSEEKGGFVNIYVWHNNIFDKTFDQINLCDISSKWGEQFIEELTYWDGCRSLDKLRYINSNQQAVDKIIAIAHLSNYRTNIYTMKKGVIRPPIRLNSKPIEQKKDCYQITFTKNNMISTRGITNNVISYEGKIYCVTVSTGMFVVRYKEKVSVTGNSQSYSYVIESLFKGKQRRDIYDRWRNNKIMFERIEFISKLYQDYIDTPNLYNFFRALIADYILEGLYFYSGFKFFNSLSSKALMTGTNSIINLIQRDEITHITLYERLINLIQAENKNIIPQELFIDIMDIAVQHENKFSISTLCNCVGFSEQIITQYTGYRANLLLKRVGIKDNPYSSFVKNPFVHFDSVAEGTDGVTRESNVFTNQVVDYQFSDAESRWTDDIFDDEDK